MATNRLLSRGGPSSERLCKGLFLGTVLQKRKGEECVRRLRRRFTPSMLIVWTSWLSLGEHSPMSRETPKARGAPPGREAAALCVGETGPSPHTGGGLRSGWDWWPVAQRQVRGAQSSTQRRLIRRNLRGRAGVQLEHPLSFSRPARLRLSRKLTSVCTKR